MKTLSIALLCASVVVASADEGQRDTDRARPGLWPEILLRVQRLERPAMPAACCRVCRKGKACGNACINRQLTCRQPRGCACDG